MSGNKDITGKETTGATSRDGSPVSVKKRSVFRTVMDQISGIFLPIINCLTAASIIKSLLILLTGFGILDKSGGLYMIFYAVSDGFFYFLPVFLAITASKQWHTDLFVSLLIPAAMLYPSLTEILENGKSLSFLGLPVLPSIYHSGVIPVLLAVGLLHFVEKPCDRIPESLRGILKPIICSIIVLPVTFIVFGPLGSGIGNGLTKVFTYLYNLNPVIAGSFLGFVIQPMVSVGAHWSIVPISISSIANIGYDVILPLVVGGVYGQCGASFALAVIYREKEKKSTAYQAALSCFLGVTEPALFGVTLRQPRAMLSACIAGAVGGAITGAAGTVCTSFAFPSIITSLAYVGKGFIPFLIAMPVTGAISFVLTYIQKNRIQEAA